MNADQITLALVNGNFSNAEINKIVEAVKFARARLVSVNKIKLAAGSRVKWTGKAGFQTGTVRKVNKKNCVVDADNGQGWNISANMLELI